MIIARKPLLDTINRILPFVGRGAPVRLSADGPLTVTAADADAAVQVYTADDVGDLAPVVVPGRLLLDIVRQCREDVTLDTTPKGLHIEADGAAYDLTAVPWTMEGARTTVERADVKPIDGGGLLALGALVGSVRHAMADKYSVYSLNGIHLGERTDTTITACATDGSRLAWAVGDATGDLPDLSKHLVPPAAVAAAVRFGGTVRLAADIPEKGAGRLYLDGPSWRWYGRLPDTDWPRWREVLPTAWGATWTVDRDALIAALRRVGTVVAKSRDRLVCATISGDSVRLSTSYTDTGRASATVPAAVMGGDLIVGLNARFMLDALARQPRTVTIRHGVTPYTPVTHCPIQVGDGDLVMPVRLN